MFLREAGISARLEHPNIVRVYEVGEADGTLFIAMEFVHGASLRELLTSARDPLPLSAAITVLEQVARAIHAAHELRNAEGKPLALVHQDVSPHNIMVTVDGTTKLLDFGVARIGALDASRTDTIRGKPCYLAPEQITGDRIDRRTDVFALGAVMFELLSGQRLFDGKSVQAVYAAITSEPLPPLAEVLPKVPEPLVEVCRRALQKEAADRFPTARAFERALEQARQAADIKPADQQQLAELVCRRAPPAFDNEKLEREIVTGSVGRSSAEPSTNDEVADLPTRPAEPASGDSQLRTKSTRVTPPTNGAQPQRRRSILLAAVVLAAITGFGLWRWGLATPDGTGNERSAQPPTKGSTVATMPAAVRSPSTPSALDPSVPLATASSGASTSVRSAAKPLTVRRADLMATAATALATGSVTPPVTATVETTASVASGSTSSTATAEKLVPARLRILSSLWGNVYLDGAHVGSSPLTVSTSPGAHVVQLVTPDDKKQTQGVTAVSGKLTVVQFTF